MNGGFRLDRRAILCIFLLALITYAPVLRLGFLWDDHVMIEQNPYLQKWSGANLRKDFTADVFYGTGDLYYRPLQTLSNRVDYTLWGLRPFGYHLTNLLVHAANAILLAYLVIALGFSDLVALLIGCLFAVHPIGVEQLMIIAGRAELFGLLFTLMTLWLWLRPRSWSWALASLTFAAGLLFKESVIITPMLGALLLYHQKRPGRSYARLAPAVILTLPYLWLRHQVVGSAQLLPKLSLLVKFFGEAFANVLFRYAGLLLVPWHLHSHRQMPHLSYAWPLLDLALILGVVWACRRRDRTALLCLGWFVLMLLPKTPAMMLGNFMLDHWAYAAAPGLLLPLAIFFSHCWDHSDRARDRRWSLLLFPLIIGWALLARLNIELRSTDEKMYRWALHFTESHPVKYNLAAVLIESGRAREAIPLLEEVRSVYPDDPRTLYALAKAYDMTGHRGAARALLKELLRRHPNDALAAQTLRTLR